MRVYKSAHEWMKYVQTIEFKSRYSFSKPRGKKKDHEPGKENWYYSRISHDPTWKSLCINLYSKDNKNR